MKVIFKLHSLFYFSFKFNFICILFSYLYKVRLIVSILQSYLSFIMFLLKAIIANTMLVNINIVIVSIPDIATLLNE